MSRVFHLMIRVSSRQRSRGGSPRVLRVFPHQSLSKISADNSHFIVYRPTTIAPAMKYGELQRVPKPRLLWVLRLIITTFHCRFYRRGGGEGQELRHQEGAADPRSAPGWHQRPKTRVEYAQYLSILRLTAPSFAFSTPPNHP